MNDALRRAHAAIEIEDWPSASHWFERRLDEQPDDLESRAWLGQCMCSLGRRARGIALLREAGVGYAARGQSAVLVEIASELQHWRNPEEALPLLEAAVRIEPGDVEARRLLAVALAQLNRIPEALSAVGDAVSLAPAERELVLLEQSLLADAGRFDEAREGLSGLLEHSLEAPLAYRAHKEMARVLDRLGIHGEVFFHLHRASGFADALPDFAAMDRNALPAMIRTNYFGYDAELIGRWSHASFSERAPVFVIGFLRSGTTLTQEVLATHPGHVRQRRSRFCDPDHSPST
jgi:tetratricopeptide (TPR) repeat protein